MKFVPIFDNQLYAVHYDDEEDNEWDRLIELWGDVEYLRDFANFNNLNDARKFVKSITNQADGLDDLLYRLEKEGLNLNNFFTPLDNNERIGVVTLSKQKARPGNQLIRLYAIKIDDNFFVITGGAIKITHKMDDHPDTKAELPKLEMVRNFLKEQDIIDKDSFYEFEQQLKDDQKGKI